MTDKQRDQALASLGVATAAYDALDGLEVRLNIMRDDEITKLAIAAINAANALRVALARKTGQ